MQLRETSKIVKEHGGLHISERRQFLCLARRGIHMNIIIICFCNFSIAAAHKNHHSPNVVGLSMDNYLLPYPIKLGPITTLLIIIIIIIMSPFFSNSGSNVETSRNDYLIRLYKICLHPKLDGIDDLIKTPLARHSHRRSAPCKEWGIIANSWGRICTANEWSEVFSKSTYHHLFMYDDVEVNFDHKADCLFTRFSPSAVQEDLCLNPKLDGWMDRWPNWTPHAPHSHQG